AGEIRDTKFPGARLAVVVPEEGL
ncbi:hypothetical protein LCGC14_3038680, partial [marine sediment metagenome]